VGDGSDLDAVSLGEYTAVAPPPTRSRRRPNSLTVAALSGLAAGLALALAVAVVHSDGDGGEAGSRVCRLLGPADIAVVLGSRVEPGRPRVLMRLEPGLGICGYPTSSSFGEIEVHEQRPGRAGFVASRQRAQGGGGVPLYHPLPGLGDQAFSVGGAVSVLVDDTFVVVGAQKPSREFEPLARQLAARAVLTLR
jgi:hypothetical protein